MLKDVSLAVDPGEVHAIIGENGAGKSTLMKLLAGHLQPTRGELRIDGKTVTLTGPVDAERRGIVLVHQEILLAPDLTVAQNVYLGRELPKGMVVDDRAMNEGARQAVRNLGADIDPDVVVRRLSIAQRQLVQIARVLLVPHRVVIFDEPTASLTPIETRALLKVIADIRAKGVGVFYISHRLPEVKQIADKVTVLRDGRVVARHPANELQPVDMARLMVGRDVAKLYPDRHAEGGRQTILEVEDFSVPGFAQHVSFQLGKGEILGFAGLVGAGRTELMEGLVGLRPGRGAIRINGKPTNAWGLRPAAMPVLSKTAKIVRGSGAADGQPVKCRWRVCQVTDSIFLIAICSKRTAQGLPPSPDANSRAASIEKTKARLVV